MLISTLVMIHLDTIIFLDKGLFISVTSELWVTLCRRTLRQLVIVRRIGLRACLQSPSVSNPLRHGKSAYGSQTTTAPVVRWWVKKAQSKGTRYTRRKGLAGREYQELKQKGATTGEKWEAAMRQWDGQRRTEGEGGGRRKREGRGREGGKERVHP